MSSSERLRDVRRAPGLFDALSEPAAPSPTVDVLLEAVRISSPEVARPVAQGAMLGAGQSARADARAKAKRTTEDAYRRIALSLEGHGPQTRKELAETTGMPVNTVNARIAEMREMFAWWMAEESHRPQPSPAPEFGVYTEGRRNGESIVHLARLRRLLAVTPPDPEAR